MNKENFHFVTDLSAVEGLLEAFKSVAVNRGGKTKDGRELILPKSVEDVIVLPTVSSFSDMPTFNQANDFTRFNKISDDVTFFASPVAKDATHREVTIPFVAEGVNRSDDGRVDYSYMEMLAIDGKEQHELVEYFSMNPNLRFESSIVPRKSEPEEIQVRYFAIFNAVDSPVWDDGFDTEEEAIEDVTRKLASARDFLKSAYREVAIVPITRRIDGSPVVSVIRKVTKVFGDLKVSYGSIAEGSENSGWVVCWMFKGQLNPS